MARFRKARRSFRRVRRFARRHRGMTPLKGVKYLIAFSGVGANAYNDWKAGGPTQALSNLTAAYSGFNPVTREWDPHRLMIGYVPLIGAWFFGKIASRVLR